MKEFNINLDANNSVFEVEINGHLYTVILEYSTELKLFHNYLTTKDGFLTLLNDVLKEDLICKPTETYTFCLTQEILHEGRPSFVMKSMIVNVYLNNLGILKLSQSEISVLTYSEFEWLMENAV